MSPHRIFVLGSCLLTLLITVGCGGMAADDDTLLDPSSGKAEGFFGDGQCMMFTVSGHIYYDQAAEEQQQQYNLIFDFYSGPVYGRDHFSLEPSPEPQSYQAQWSWEDQRKFSNEQLSSIEEIRDQECSREVVEGENDDNCDFFNNIYKALQGKGEALDVGSDKIKFHMYTASGDPGLSEEVSTLTWWSEESQMFTLPTTAANQDCGLSVDIYVTFIPDPYLCKVLGVTSISDAPNSEVDERSDFDGCFIATPELNPSKDIEEIELGEPSA